MNKNQYILRHLRRTARLERIYAPAMAAAIRAYVSAFTRTMRERGAQAAMTARYDTGRITKVIDSVYRSVGMFYARLTTREINGSVERKAYVGISIPLGPGVADDITEQKGFGINAELDERILMALSKSIFRDVNSISESIKKQIITIVEQGLKEGWGIDRMLQEITDADIPTWRSRMIIRTELTKAMNAGQQAARDESEFETVDTWISTHDARTRHSHTLIDGYKIRRGEKFPVRKRKGGFDMMTGPGDPTASAENVVNCRCTKVTRALRENGRLVRKRKIFVALPGQMTRPAAITI